MNHYTQDQLKNLSEYLVGKLYLGDRKKSKHEVIVSDLLKTYDYSLQKMKDSVEEQNLDLMTNLYSDFSGLFVPRKKWQSILGYYTIKTLELPREDISLYINTEIVLVRNIIMWRIGRDI